MTHHSKLKLSDTKCIWRLVQSSKCPSSELFSASPFMLYSLCLLAHVNAREPNALRFPSWAIPARYGNRQTVVAMVPASGQMIVNGQGDEQVVYDEESCPWPKCHGCGILMAVSASWCRRWRTLTLHHAHCLMVMWLLRFQCFVDMNFPFCFKILCQWELFLVKYFLTVWRAVQWNLNNVY